jgi:hypothetical protein
MTGPQGSALLRSLLSFGGIVVTVIFGFLCFGINLHSLFLDAELLNIQPRT